MELSFQNKNFLSLLSSLGVDIRQFPDKTFDELFENVPQTLKYFFNWFLENVSSDNCLTQAEQAMYFEFEKSHLLPTVEECEEAILSSDYTFEELQTVDSKYVDNLEEELKQLEELNQKLKNVNSRIDLNLDLVKKKNIKLTEMVNISKKELKSIKHECDRENLSLNKKLDGVKDFLLRDSNENLDFTCYTSSLELEKKIFKDLDGFNYFKSELADGLDKDDLQKLEEDLVIVENCLIFSQCSLKEKKSRIKFLSEIYESVKRYKNFSMLDNYLISKNPDAEEESIKKIRDIQILEKELKIILKESSHYEIQCFIENYYSKKEELCNSYLTKLNTLKDYLEQNEFTSMWLIHIKDTCFQRLNDVNSCQKDIYLRIINRERNLSNDISNFEMKQQRCKVSVMKSQQSILNEFKSFIAESSESDFDLMKFWNFAFNDCNFITSKSRTDFKTTLKAFLDANFCGPTSQLLFAPIDLLVKYQNCDRRKLDLSHEIKCLANEYVKSKKIISTSDWSKLLTWMDVVIRAEA